MPGSGDTEIVGGWGNDRFVAGLGDSTISGGPGKDVYAFIRGSSGGHDIIWGFDGDDRIKLEGYGGNAVKAALSSQVQVGGGAIQIFEVPLAPAVPEQLTIRVDDTDAAVARLRAGGFGVAEHPDLSLVASLSEPREAGARGGLGRRRPDSHLVVPALRSGERRVIGEGLQARDLVDQQAVEALGQDVGE
jgi:hypothetical protein